MRRSDYKPPCCLCLCVVSLIRRLAYARPPRRLLSHYTPPPPHQCIKRLCVEKFESLVNSYRSENRLARHGRFCWCAYGCVTSYERHMNVVLGTDHRFSAGVWGEGGRRNPHNITSVCSHIICAAQANDARCSWQDDGSTTPMSHHTKRPCVRAMCVTAYVQHTHTRTHVQRSEFTASQ